MTLAFVDSGGMVDGVECNGCAKRREDKYERIYLNDFLSEYPSLVLTLLVLS